MKRKAPAAVRITGALKILLQTEPIISYVKNVSEILNGKRRLTLKMIRSLHSGLGIPA
jgi:antitoxin component HigA of HigAB toxin-antitoxin module